MRILLIGLGEFGKHHLRVLKELGHSVITCDSYNKEAQITDYMTEVLPETGSYVDAVVITTPASTHYEIAKYMLERRVPCLVEKPMTLNYQQAQNLVNIATENETVFSVGQIFRYHPLTNRIKRELDRILDQEQGKILVIRANRIGMRNPRTDCNVLWDFASHDIDLIDYIYSGEPVDVKCVARNVLSHNLEDIASLTYRYTGGTPFIQIDVDWLSPVKERTLTIICDKETLHADYLKNELRIYKSGILKTTQLGDYYFNVKSGDMIVPNIKYEEPLKLELQDFLSCVESGDETKSNASSCLPAIKLLDTLVGH